MTTEKTCLGCDVGALATKTIILRDGMVIGSDITLNGGRLGQAIQQSLDNALAMAKLSIDDIECAGGTGWGERYIPFEHDSVSVISSLARGAHWADPSVRSVIDIGGLSSTALIMNEAGGVKEYRSNDRCAAGTGFFLEQAAQALELEVEALCPVACTAEERARISAQCAVFGESEIVSHLNEGEDVPSIAAGIAYAVASGAATMLKRLGIQPELMVTGGVAKSRSVVRELEEGLDIKTVESSSDPQILAAVGAALLARDKGRGA
jgi:predicted CoA-substrate-specific enzyme activase